MNFAKEYWVLADQNADGAYEHELGRLGVLMVKTESTQAGDPRPATWLTRLHADQFDSIVSRQDETTPELVALKKSCQQTQDDDQSITLILSYRAQSGIFGNCRMT